MENQHPKPQSYERPIMWQESTDVMLSHQFKPIDLATYPDRKMGWGHALELIIALGRKVQTQYAGLMDGIYGLPGGGSIVAMQLAPQLNLPIVEHPSESTLIVDDYFSVVKSLAHFPSKYVAALHVHNDVHMEPVICIERTPSIIHYPWMDTHDSTPESLIVGWLKHLKEDPSRDGLLETPRRVVKSWSHLFSGYSKDAASVLKTQFHEGGADGIVICKNIEMYSTCEHHLLPFFGKAAVGYVPKEGRIVGLSKLARVVEIFSRRLQNQERLTRQVAEALQDALDPLAVGVVMEAEHFCMRARGVEKQNSRMVTFHLLGQFRENENRRKEFLELVHT